MHTYFTFLGANLNFKMLFEKTLVELYVCFLNILFNKWKHNMCNYLKLSSFETDINACNEYIELIKKYYRMPHNAELVIKLFNNNYEVCAFYDNLDYVSTNWAFSVENDDLNVLKNYKA